MTHLVTSSRLGRRRNSSKTRLTPARPTTSTAASADPRSHVPLAVRHAVTCRCRARRSAPSGPQYVGSPAKHADRPSARYEGRDQTLAPGCMRVLPSANLRPNTIPRIERWRTACGCTGSTRRLGMAAGSVDASLGRPGAFRRIRRTARSVSGQSQVAIGILDESSANRGACRYSNVARSSKVDL